MAKIYLHQNQAGNLSYDVFVNDPPPQDGFLPNGEPKRFSPMASTLIYGNEDAVLTDPGMTEDQARVLGDWVAGHGRNVTDIFITHGHGDHWFAAGLLATAWDQDVALPVMSPVAARLHDVVTAWLAELLGLPAGTAAAFVSRGVHGQHHRPDRCA